MPKEAANTHGACYANQVPFLPKNDFIWGDPGNLTPTCHASTTTLPKVEFAVPTDGPANVSLMTLTSCGFRLVEETAALQLTNKTTLRKLSDQCAIAGMTHF